MGKGNSLEIHPEFIAVSLKLDRGSEMLPDCLEELASACAENTCRHILGHVDGPLGALTVADVFEMATYLANAVPALRIALLVGEDDSEELREFFKLAASNRGLTIDFFTDRNKALRWLKVDA